MVRLTVAAPPPGRQRFKAVCAGARRPWRTGLAGAGMVPINSLRASTIITPAKPGHSRAPSRSKTVDQRTTHGRSIGGMNSALVHSNGVNIASFNSRSSWPRL